MVTLTVDVKIDRKESGIHWFAMSLNMAVQYVYSDTELDPTAMVGTLMREGEELAMMYKSQEKSK